jgi:chromosome segregation ATPase
MANPVSDEARLTAEIERLKAEFPKTRELYREVCALLFFRFGITPTANRLYQLVHRGSMGTPTAVLSEFWAELREKSRVRIEHPDLPAEVRQAAGELVATLWSRASAAANAALDGLRADVDAQQRDAQQSVEKLQADLARTETALEQRTTALLSAQVRIHELEQSLASAEAARTALDDEREQLRQQSRDHDTTFAQAQAAFASERDRLRAGIELADTHRQAAEKRVTLEVERERAANARLQRDAETATQALADARAELRALQKQLGDLRHRNGTLEGQLEAMREANAWRDKKAAASTPPAVKRARPADVSAKQTRQTKQAKVTSKRAAKDTQRTTRKARSGGSGSRSGS